MDVPLPSIDPMVFSSIAGGGDSVSKSPPMSPISTVVEHEVPLAAHCETGTRVFLGGCYSREEVISFGGISEDGSLVRASDRIKMQCSAMVITHKWRETWL
jgi:hypothetical protein